MTTADYAFVVSICSAIVALASFIWNVWSKFIFPKPHIRASAAISSLHWGARVTNRHLSLSLTNHGPGEVTIHCVSAVHRPKPWKRREWGMLNPINNFPIEPYESHGPFSGGLPKKLLVGETFTLHFPYEPSSFLAMPLSGLGVADTFGTYHWIRRSQLKLILAQFYKDFPNAKRLRWGDETVGTPPEAAEEFDY